MLLALLGAWSWRHLAADPGYVLITFAGWSIEASLLAILLLAVFAWAAVRLVLLLLRGPFRLLRRRRKAKARERLASGMLALQQGQPKRAERLLRRAARDPVQRGAALLLAAECARQRGDDGQRRSYLLQIAESDPHGLGALAEAQALLESGQPELAVELLERAAREQPPQPAAVELRARALAAAGRAGEGLLLLPDLRRQRSREGQDSSALENDLAAAALQQAATAEELDAVWGSLAKPVQGSAQVLRAYGLAGRRLGRQGEAASALERAIDRDWDDDLAGLWGLLVDGDLRRAIKRGERWLESHPDSPGLLLALGRLCHREQLWGKAEDFLQRAVAGRPAEAWEALGALYVDRGDHARAQQALRNAIASGRGEAASPVRALLAAPVEETIAEHRSSMGLPQLPAGRPL
nr:heme biosynthesis HemY N-terminal domain-containing protein [Lysobacter sp. CAU 1642]